MTKKTSAIIGQTIIWISTVVAMGMLTAYSAPLVVIVPILSTAALLGVLIQAASLRDR